MGLGLGNHQSWDLGSDSINWRISSAVSSNVILGKIPLDPITPTLLAKLQRTSERTEEKELRDCP